MGRQPHRRQRLLRACSLLVVKTYLICYVDYHLIPNPHFLVDLKLEVMGDHGDTSIVRYVGPATRIFSAGVYLELSFNPFMPQLK